MPIIWQLAYVPNIPMFIPAMYLSSVIHHIISHLHSLQITIAVHFFNPIKLIVTHCSIVIEWVTLPCSFDRKQHL